MAPKSSECRESTFERTWSFNISFAKLQKDKYFRSGSFHILAESAEKSRRPWAELVPIVSTYKNISSMDIVKQFLNLNSKLKYETFN